MAGELVEIGRVTRPHGVRGELRITPFTLSPEAFCRFDRVIIQSREHGRRLVGIRQARPHKTTILVQLEEVRDRNQAESLVGAKVLVQREWLPETEPDEYYWTDLIGLKVFNEDGSELGLVENLIRTDAHDILVVNHHGREVLIPFLDEFVGEVDIANRRIPVTLPEDLLEL